MYMADIDRNKEIKVWEQTINILKIGINMNKNLVLIDVTTKFRK